MLRSPKRYWFGGFAFVVLAACVSYSVAQGPSGPFEHGPPFGGHHGPFHNMMLGKVGRLMVLRSELNVTHEQHQKLFGIAKSHHSEVSPTVKSLSTAMRQLRDQVIADNPNEAQIRSAAGELGKAIADAAVLASKVATEVKTIATVEQLDLMKKHFADEDRAQDKFVEELKKFPEMRFPR